MASDWPPKKHIGQTAEEEFERILNRVGGKGKVYLVSDAVENKDTRNILQEFIVDIFPDELSHATTSNCLKMKPCTEGNGVDSVGTCSTGDGDQIHHHCQQDKKSESKEVKGIDCFKVGTGNKTTEEGNGVLPRTVRFSGAVTAKGRAIDSALIIFIFCHDYVGCKSNYVCLKEIMKDVRARLNHSRVCPALLGLIHSDSDSTETQQSVEVLEYLLRSVFRNHPRESIWAGHFIPRAPEKSLTIRRQACRAIISSLTTDDWRHRNGHLSWILHCLPGSLRQRPGNQDNSTTDNCEKGESPCMEEGIPLRTREQS